MTKVGTIIYLFVMIAIIVQESIQRVIPSGG